MVFSELPVGTEFYFGSITVEEHRYVHGRGRERRMVEHKMTWKKTALDGLAICVEENPYQTFDYAHTVSGQNRYMRAHGHRAFFLSSLYKYLNCDNGSWCQVSQGDALPYYANEPGFLSRFSPEEIAFMMPYSMTVNMPTGYTKQYGTTMTKNVLVGIPSREQIGDRMTTGTFGLSLPSNETWLSDADTLSNRMRYGYLSRVGGENPARVMPVIKIKPDSPVDLNENGKFIIRVPEVDFSGDLMSFLGLEAAA